MNLVERPGDEDQAFPSKFYLRERKTAHNTKDSVKKHGHFKSDQEIYLSKDGDKLTGYEDTFPSNHNCCRRRAVNQTH